MDYQKLLRDLRYHYDEQKFFFTEEDNKFNTCRDYRSGRLHGFFTKAYHVRQNLFLRGHVVYALTIKSYFEGENEENDYPSWVLFSPQLDFELSPEKYYEIARGLETFLLRKPRGRKERLLRQILNGELSEPQYFEIPESLTEGKLVFLSVCYVRVRQHENFRLGLNVILMDRTLTKEVVYLPTRYFSDDYLNFYCGKNQL